MNAQHHEAVSLTVESLLNERHSLKTGTTQQPIGQGLWLGPFRGVRRGQGTEFDDLRHYCAGDDIRHIDWKASARTHALHTRLYREEREYRTTFVVDFRNAMFAGSKELQAVRVGRLAARILWQANDGGCRTQLILVTDKGICISKSGSGHQSAIDSCALIARVFNSIQIRLDNNHKNHVQLKTSDTLQLEFAPLFPLPTSDSNTNQSGIDLDQVAEWILQQEGQSGNVFWLSPFDNCGDNFKDHLNLLSQRSNQIAIILDDELIDKGLPKGRYSYKHTNNKQANNHTTSLKRLALLGRNSSARLLEILTRFKKQRYALLEESMMIIVGDKRSNNEILASLRHHGLLP